MAISVSDLVVLVEAAKSIVRLFEEFGSHVDPKELTDELQTLVSEWKNEVLAVDIVAMRQRAELNAAVPPEDEGGHSGSDPSDSPN